MSKTWINFVLPGSNKRTCGVVNNSTKEVKTAGKGTFTLPKLLKQNNDGGIGFFETRDENGKIIQKTGRPQ